ncbi:zinc finger HIT domain-containing protein 3-like isoform X2 [Actinia tenebrosa]|uniref:Zinc finger HIT domain-containing protein 3 n=1 Tax=Actinia tenebrosa TaxID=6105 RepID=A0A6P8HJX5_ACTTE|nr:zinc finger HIT domain-containing protein 3-like isoform X2 [Actinia tenebrosa]
MKSGESKRLCQICKESPFKYRCPSCYFLYCSLPCFKSHKENICELETGKRKKESENVDTGQQEGQISNDENSEDEDRLSLSDLKKLEKCGVIESMLKNKDIRKMITNIDGAQDPEMVLRTSMKEPIFMEFADQCLSVVESKNENDG